MTRSTIAITVPGNDAEGDFEDTHELPAKNEVCPRCDGYGTHLNPNIGEHAYTREEFEESFDEEGREEYFKRGGIYDVTCETCHGNRVVLSVDEDRLTDEQKKVFERWQDHQALMRRYDYEDRMTRRGESGGYDY